MPGEFLDLGVGEPGVGQGRSRVEFDGLLEKGNGFIEVRAVLMEQVDPLYILRIRFPGNGLHGRPCAQLKSAGDRSQNRFGERRGIAGGIGALEGAAQRAAARQIGQSGGRRDHRTGTVQSRFEHVRGAQHILGIERRIHTVTERLPGRDDREIPAGAG